LRRVEPTLPRPEEYVAAVLAGAPEVSPKRDPEVQPTAPLASSLTRDERAAFGREARDLVPLAEHARIPDPRHRVDPVDLLTAQDATRLQRLVPIRHGRMSATPFTFYRGAAAVMAADLAAVPTTPLGVQLCGDAHLANFGVFNGPHRALLFDLNDFDETHPGPFEWDLKRLVASVVLAGRDNEVSETKTEVAARAAVAGYRTTMVDAAKLDPLSLRVGRLEVDEVLKEIWAGLAERDRKAVEKTKRRARAKNSMRAFDRLTEVVDGHRLIVEDPPRVTRFERDADDLREQTLGFFELYLTTLPAARRCLFTRYRLVDAAYKVVGVGSVGTRCLIALFVSGDEEPLFLQIKEANRSVLEAHLAPSEYDNDGERVVQGQRMMQAEGDPFLGWSRAHPVDTEHRDFYVRQLWDGKGSAAVELMDGRRLALYAELCGRALALAHARTGDAATIAGYIGDDDAFDQAITAFAAGYADLAVVDHRAHVAAIDAGEIEVVRDI
jgi:uncharacterized protein (DUF2252 family)